MQFTLLVFDWDGTLMDSEARIVRCLQAAAQDLQLSIPTREQSRNIIGLGLHEAVTALFPEADGTLINRLAEAYRHHFLGADPTPAPLFPGAEEVLRQLASEEYLLAIATGKGRRGLERVLDETGLRDLFHCTRCADETFSKPHPEMLLQIMAVLDVAPQQTLMIGDTEYDMQMAIHAGSERLAVSYGVHASERLLQHQPLGCLDAIAELPAWLGLVPAYAE